MSPSWFPISPVSLLHLESSLCFCWGCSAGVPIMPQASAAVTLPAVAYTKLHQPTAVFGKFFCQAPYQLLQKLKPLSLQHLMQSFLVGTDGCHTFLFRSHVGSDGCPAVPQKTSVGTPRPPSLYMSRSRLQSLLQPTDSLHEIWAQCETFLAARPQHVTKAPELPFGSQLPELSRKSTRGESPSLPDSPASQSPTKSQDHKPPETNLRQLESFRRSEKIFMNILAHLDDLDFYYRKAMSGKHKATRAGLKVYNKSYSDRQTKTWYDLPDGSCWMTEIVQQIPLGSII